MGPGREPAQRGQMGGTHQTLADAASGQASARPADTRRVIYFWSAKRAGGRITISGSHGQGEPVKIAGFDLIDVESGKVIAHHKDGEEIILAV